MMSDIEVELESFEAVVPGGVRRVTWLVLQDEKWTLVSDSPDARIEQREGGAGMIWLRRVVLRLPLGARLKRVESLPRRETPRDPLAYLLSPTKGGDRETRRSYFVLARGGKLERIHPRRT